ncbi:hypothetical protein AB0L40_13150 [Patulibacter sp. NPDC049589]|uniref:hypothetical protein n=1 Tax=Patulibacter sp. NPDC049589 TaxID=3154731 RepID=UPI003429B1CA
MRILMALALILTFAVGVSGTVSRADPAVAATTKKATPNKKCRKTPAGVRKGTVGKGKASARTTTARGAGPQAKAATKRKKKNCGASSSKALMNLLFDGRRPYRVADFGILGDTTASYRDPAGGALFEMTGHSRYEFQPRRLQRVPFDAVGSGAADPQFMAILRPVRVQATSTARFSRGGVSWNCSAHIPLSAQPDSIVVTATSYEPGKVTFELALATAIWNCPEDANAEIVHFSLSTAGSDPMVTTPGRTLEMDQVDLPEKVNVEFDVTARWNEPGGPKLKQTWQGFLELERVGRPIS